MIERKNITGFTLTELLVVISSIGLLLSVLLPALGSARQRANALVCMSNLRQLGLGWQLYAAENDDYAMATLESRTSTYWWGCRNSKGVDHEQGFLWPYLGSELLQNGVYECPSQPYGSYDLQHKPDGAPDDPKWVTSTYGYNGYYLSPAQSGWNAISHRPRQRTTTIKNPSELIVFADALLYWGGGRVTNTALLDPPYLLARNRRYWQRNNYPTTCFRHQNKTNIIFADGRAASTDIGDQQYTNEQNKIGSVGNSNAPHYVPDYKHWVQPRARR